jgi:hypothetical protein
MPKVNTLPMLIEKLELTESGCWEWKGGLDQHGYGAVSWGNKMHRTHRVFYMSLIRGIPEGLVIDHLCRNRKCCNPFHMEPVTLGENVKRGEAGLKKRMRTHCTRGHEYTKENVSIDKEGYGRCLPCHRELSKKWKERNKGKS